MSNKRYEKCRIASEEGAKIFRGYYGDYELEEATLIRLSKDLGFSYPLYETLSDVSTEAADSLVVSISLRNEHPEIILLLDEDSKKVIGYSLDADRAPLLNKEFIHRVRSLAETSNQIRVSEVYYHDEDTVSSIIVQKCDPIIVEEKYKDRESRKNPYQIGVLLVNDELNNTYSRLVLYVEGQPLYLPSSYYSTTTSRYRRSTSNSMEALEVLMLKVIDDLRDDAMYNKIYDFHYRYRANKDIYASYEEYNTLLRTMRKIPTIIEDNSYLDDILTKYDYFDKKYPHIEEKKSSYVWRCTAFGDIPVGALVSTTSKILTELDAPPVEYYAVRELLGTYISTNRIAEEIAREE